jgi:hypothetical protein
MMHFLAIWQENGLICRSNWGRMKKPNAVAENRWCRNQILGEVRALHRAHGDISFTGQRDKPLWAVAQREFGSYRRAVEAAGIKYETISRSHAPRWNKSLIKKELRRIHAHGEAMNSRAIRQSHSQLFAATLHWFGSYRAAIEATGLNYEKIRVQDPHRWNRQAITDEIRRLHREKKPLHHSAVGRDCPEMVTAAYRYFGTYRKAVEAAGLDYLKVRVRPLRTWNKKRVIAELKSLHHKQGGMWMRSVRKSNPYLPRVASAYFGSYNTAARAAGIQAGDLTPPPYRKWSAEHVLEELKRLAKEDVKQLAPTLMREKHPYLVRSAKKRFGSYRRAVEKVGVDYLSIARVYARPMPAYEVVAQLQLLQQRGKDLRYNAMGRSNPRLLNAARRRFGSYEKAMRIAGIAYPPLPPLRHWSEKLVLNTLLALHDRGEDVRYRSVKIHRLPLYEAARYYFGSYTNAVRVAGIGYTRMAKTQRLSERRRKLLAYRATRRVSR